jgi:hypothetical protein
MTPDEVQRITTFTERKPMITIELKIFESDDEAKAQVIHNVADFTPKELQYLKDHLYEMKGVENPFFLAASEILAKNGAGNRPDQDRHQAQD